MADTNLSAINDLLPTTIATAVEHFETMPSAVNLIENYVMAGNTLQIPTWDDTVAVYAMTEGVPMGTAQQMTTGNATITAAKYGGKVRITDEAMKDARNTGKVEDLMQRAGRELAIKLLKQANSLVTSLFSGFSQGSGSGSGTTLTPALMMTAATTVEAEGPLSSPFFILHPWHIHYYKLDANYRATYPVNPAAASGGVGSWLREVEPFNGYNVYKDGTLAVASSAAYGACLTRESLAIGVSWSPAESTEVTRIESTGYDVAATIRCGVIEVKDKGGFYLNYKAA